MRDAETEAALAAAFADGRVGEVTRCTGAMIYRIAGCAAAAGASLMPDPNGRPVS